jgi:hypothetical protein
VTCVQAVQAKATDTVPAATSVVLLLLLLQVASAVIELQALLPNARVLYCSATGVSEVSGNSTIPGWRNAGCRARLRVGCMSGADPSLLHAAGLSDRLVLFTAQPCDTDCYCAFYLSGV